MSTLKASVVALVIASMLLPGVANAWIYPEHRDILAEALVGLPPGKMSLPIFNMVLKRITVRGSIVGTRQDLAEALEFYARGEIHPTVSSRGLSEINAVFDEMKHGKIDGRVVIKY